MLEENLKLQNQCQKQFGSIFQHNCSSVCLGDLVLFWEEGHQDGWDRYWLPGSLPFSGKHRDSFSFFFFNKCNFLKKM